MNESPEQTPPSRRVNLVSGSRRRPMTAVVLALAAYVITVDDIDVRNSLGAP
jgi:hypothetical protein